MADEKLKHTDNLVTLLGEKGETLSLKPLTEGLGFKDRVQADRFSVDSSIGGLSSDSGELDMGHPAVDDGQVSVDHKGVLQLKSDGLVKPILRHSGHDGLIKPGTKKSYESFFAATIDALFVLSISVIVFGLYVDTLGITDLETLQQNQIWALKAGALIFSCGFLIYKVFARGFFGKTLGEWACHLQMGSTEDHTQWHYPFRVLVRDLASLLTGVFVLPLLSSMFKTDLGYRFSGLHTHLEVRP